MQRKILSLLLALAVCLGLAAPAMAGSFDIQDGVLMKYTGTGGDVVIPKGVKTIGIWAFKECADITSITIPDSVTTIKQGAFSHCSSLTSITIPASVTKLEGFLFYACSSLTDINVDPENSAYTDVDGILYTKDMQDLRECPPGKSGVCTIPDGVARIKDSAFRGCAGLTGVVIPDSVKEIELLAFQDCTGLTDVTISNGVTSIGSAAFDNCSSLTSVCLPASVIKMGNSPFSACSSLVSITAASESNTYSDIDGVLYSKDLKSLISYPAGKKESAYAVPDSTASITAYSFNECGNLTTVSIPKSVSSIGVSAWDGCSQLSSIMVDSGNSNYTDIDGVLYSKDKNTLLAYPSGRNGTYTIPDGTTDIEQAAFRLCSGLVEVEMPESVRYIGAHTWDGCAGLASVTISGSAKNIGNYAFQGCKELTDVYYTGTESDWNKIEIGYGNSYLLGDKFTAGAAIHFNTPNPVGDTAVPFGPVSSFTDVPADAYFAAPVAWAVKNGITSGTGDNKFSPNQNCTNAQILTFIWRAYGEPEPTVENPFTNAIPDGYAKAAVWAYEKGMVSGTTFDVDKPCTRAMAMTYLWQAAGSPETEPTGKFTDVDASDPYAQAVAWAVANGITKGATDTTFAPESICQRGQIAVFLYNAVAKN